MVKVLVFQLFDKQQVVGPTEEPIDIVEGSEGFFVATKNGHILLYSSGVECVLLNRFKTQNSDLFSVKYLPELDAIVTLEGENNQSDLNVVRVYHNWRPGSLIQTQAPIDADARRTYTLPTNPASVNALTVCPLSNTIAVACGCFISVWAAGAAYAQPIRLLSIDAPWPVVKLCLSRDHLAYCSTNEVRAITFHLEALPTESVDDNKTEAQVPVMVASEATPLDEFYVELDFSASATGGLPSSARVDMPSVRKAEPPEQASVTTGEFDVTAAREMRHGVRAHARAGYRLKSCHTLLQRVFAQDVVVHTVALLPEYQAFVVDQPASREQSVNMRLVVATSREGYLYFLRQPASVLACSYEFTSNAVCSIANHCFLFTITNTGLETWSIRPFDAGNFRVYPEPCLMGIQSFIGLEAITVAQDHVILLSKVYEDEKRNAKGGKTKPAAAAAPARSTTAPAAISASSTRGISAAAAVAAGKGASQSSNQSESSTESQRKRTRQAGKEAMNWSLYVLHPTPIAHLHEDILQRAQHYDDPKAPVHFQLILEGYVLLQARLAELQRGGLSAPVDAAPAGEVDVAAQLARKMEIKTYQQLLRTLTGLLADFQMHLGEYASAAYFFAQSSRLLSDVVQLMNNSEAGHSLVGYLNSVLFEPGMLEIVNETPTLADLILQHYFKHAPQSLAPVILYGALSQYSQSEALTLLEELRTEAAHMTPAARPSQLSIPTAIGPGALEAFVCALLYLDLGRVEQAGAALASMDAVTLAACITASPPGLLAPPPAASQEPAGPAETGSGGNRVRLGSASRDSPSAGDAPAIIPTLAALLLAHAPWVLLEACVTLVLDRPDAVMTPQEALALLASSQDESLPLAECYLEAALQRHMASSKNTEPGATTTTVLPSFPVDDVFSRLLEAYVQRVRRAGSPMQSMLSTVAALEKTGRQGHAPNALRDKWLGMHERVTVGKRYPWLNLLPPFVGIAMEDPMVPLQRPVLRYLFKAQSLLCSDVARDQQAVNGIVDVNGATEYEGKVSLKLLCLAATTRIDEILQLLIPANLHVTVPCGASLFKTSEHWQTLLRRLLAVPPTEGDAGRKAVGAVMQHLSESMAPAALLSVIPNDGDVGFFLPYIDQACRRAKGRKQLTSSDGPGDL